MSLQLVSDLHLEFHKKFPDEIFNRDFVEADYLFCAGDIGIPNPGSNVWKEFIDWAVLSYKKVFYVDGNHEHYGQNRNETLAYIDHYTHNINNFVRLDTHCCDKIELNECEYFVIGCALWSNVTDATSEKMNDIKSIYKDGGQLITASDIRIWNREHISWITDWFSTEHELETIVMTHYLPSYELIHNDFRNPQSMSVSSAFATHLDDYIAKSKLWLFGHTHRRIDKMVEGVRCVSNPMGYKDEQNFTFTKGTITMS